MSEHYYSPNPLVKSAPTQLRIRYRDQEYDFITDRGVFSRNALDRGTELLIETLEDETDLRNRSLDFLDLGCGYGAVAGILGKRLPQLRLHLSDINARAVEISRRNLQNFNLPADIRCGGGLTPWAEKRFDLIALNPPIRIGKEAVFDLYQEAWRALRPGGALYLVIGKKQGAASHEKYLRTRIQAEVIRLKRARSYVILRCRKIAESADA